jgi:beta-propeller uncharacterized protein DUF5122
MRFVRAAVVVSALSAALAVQPMASATVTPSPMRSASFDGTVYATARSGSVIFVGGSFTHATDSTGTHTRRNLAAVSASTGRLLPWSPSTNSTVYALTVSKGRVYAGGSFTRTNGVPVARLVQLYASSGRLVPGFRPRVDYRIRALALSPSTLYAGGRFTHANGRPRAHLAAFSRSTGALRSWAPSADKSVRVLRRRGAQLFVGGAFNHINGVAHTNKVAAVSLGRGSVYRSFRSPVRYLVTDIRLTRTRVFLAKAGPGGAVVAAGNKGGVAWGRSFDGDVDALTILDGVIYAGGHFGYRCRTNRVSSSNGNCLDSGQVRAGRLAVLSLSGRFSSWDPAADSTVGVLTLSSVPGLHRLAAGGAFQTFHGSQRQPGFALFRAR